MDSPIADVSLRRFRPNAFTAHQCYTHVSEDIASAANTDSQGSEFQFHDSDKQ